MVFDESGKVRPGIEEACYSGVEFCEDMYDCWRTEDSWGVLIRGTGITSDENSLLFEWLYFLLKHMLSQGVFCEDMDEFWQTKESWGGFMTKLFNGGGTGITYYDNQFLF